MSNHFHEVSPHHIRVEKTSNVLHPDVIVIRSQYLPGHRHATSNLRLLIASTIASSFSSISIARLQRWLDFSSAEEAKAFVEGVNGWKVSGDNVAIEGNGDNDVKPSVIKEHVELKRASRLPAADHAETDGISLRIEQDHWRRCCLDETVITKDYMLVLWHVVCKVCRCTHFM